MVYTVFVLTNVSWLVKNPAFQNRQRNVITWKPGEDCDAEHTRHNWFKSLIVVWNKSCSLNLQCQLNMIYCIDFSGSFRTINKKEVTWNHAIDHCVKTID